MLCYQLCISISIEVYNHWYVFTGIHNICKYEIGTDTVMFISV